MPEFEHNLNKTEVTWGLISVAGIRDYFPPPSEKIVVFDDEERKYVTKMHSSAARIDGITDWFRNHHAKIGDAVVIRLNQDGSISLSLKKETVTSVVEGPTSIEIVPSVEKLLEDFLERNLRHIEEGLKLYKDENGVPGRQFSTDVGTIDLLCLDKHNDFVILELKKERGSDKVVGQITRYMGWVKKKLAKGDQQVRGIIIVHEIDEDLEYSVSVVNNVEIKYYRIDLKFISRELLSS